MSRCSDFRIFEGANVNTMVRQFLRMDDPEGELSEAGMQLGRMVQLDALQSQIGSGPVGCVFLRVDPGEAEHCTDDFVLDRALGMLPPGRGLILLSGRFEEVAGEVFLFTRLQLQRGGEDESFRLAPGGAPGAEELLGELPVTDVSFSPRRFGVEELRSLSEALERPLTLYRAPRADGSGTVLGLEELESFSYRVLENRPGWMRIVSDGDRTGWIEVRETVGEVPLRRLLPELGAVQATALYLQTRIAGGRLSLDQRRRRVEAFEGLVRTFRRYAQDGGDQVALGMLEAMAGGLELNAGDADPAASLERAREHFDRAATALPANVRALALRDLSGILVSPHPDSGGAELEATLLRLMRLDPAGVMHRVNLEKVYRRREATGITGRPEVQALRARLAADPQVRARLDR
jgi:hypothetical protein